MKGNAKEPEQSKLTLEGEVQTTAGAAVLSISEVEFQDFEFDGETRERIKLTGIIVDTDEQRILWIPRPKSISSGGRAYLSQIYDEVGLDGDEAENDIRDLIGKEIPVELSKFKHDDGNTYDRLKWINRFDYGDE